VKPVVAKPAATKPPVKPAAKPAAAKSPAWDPDSPLPPPH
jgi:hypothetical protein